MSDIFPPFTKRHEFTGPTTAISCKVNWDETQELYHAVGNNGMFHGMAHTSDGAALNCFKAWMTQEFGWFEAQND